jgi:hypothetical protein
LPVSCSCPGRPNRTIRSARRRCCEMPERLPSPKISS